MVSSDRPRRHGRRSSHRARAHLPYGLRRPCIQHQPVVSELFLLIPLHSDTLQLNQEAKNSVVTAHVREKGVNDKKLRLYVQHQPVVSEWFSLISSDAWRVKDFLCLDNEHIFGGGDQGDAPEIMDEILTTARDLELEVNEDDIEELIMGHEYELTIELQEILNEEHQETQRNISPSEQEEDERGPMPISAIKDLLKK
ncbi:hypothetical protein TNCV_1757811 [Trichonephila clavipes]|nr:hypothetical protein TNCV_1757811 [Trichonephila clavipes]